jgi:hypothetical protein
MARRPDARIHLGLLTSGGVARFAVIPKTEQPDFRASLRVAQAFSLCASLRLAR